mgnify:CR=1 FL=1
MLPVGFRTEDDLCGILLGHEGGSKAKRPEVAAFVTGGSFDLLIGSCKGTNYMEERNLMPMGLLQTTRIDGYKLTETHVKLLLDFREHVLSPASRLSSGKHYFIPC